ncbi:MAG TPA: transposase zinc-binding domain-containing protein [Spirochaetia bacterium]|nr:transposase zinc-binding domain-containing protein [Spirochaetia bacterium]
MEKFILCGDYTQGIARIRCTNPECREEFFRPFSCKGFHLCPSCSQKRTLLFAEYAENDLLLRLPHRFVTLSLPKCLRVFFRHDRKLFSELSRLIFDLIRGYFTEAAGSRDGGAGEEMKLDQTIIQWIESALNGIKHGEVRLIISEKRIVKIITEDHREHSIKSELRT